jgi:hydrogenase expression/formation protein HypC
VSGDRRILSPRKLLRVCQAIPRRILQVDGPRLEVDLDGARAWIDAYALPDLAVGQYVIVHAGQALEQIPEVEALEVLALYAELPGLVGESIP